MAKYAGLPWDVILGAEPAQAYKPAPKTCLTGAELLGLKPAQVMMVAAHRSGLLAAAAQGRWGSAPTVGRPRRPIRPLTS